MKKYRKSRRVNSKQISSAARRQKQFSKKQRRRFRRQQNRMKRQVHCSSSITTQIPTDAFNMLYISNESNTKSLEFIRRHELTRQQVLTMPYNQRPVLFLTEHKSSESFPNNTYECYNTIDEKYYSSFV